MLNRPSTMTLLVCLAMQIVRAQDNSVPAPVDSERWNLYRQLAGVERHAPDGSITKVAEAAPAAAAAEEELP